MSTFLQDVRYAARTLVKSPGFTAVSVITLALGIGANTAIFSYLDGVLLKPLPYGDPERILAVWEKPPGSDRNGISTLNFLDWKNQNTVFDGMAAVTGVSMTMSGAGEPVMLRGSAVSAPYFDIFGVKAALGRTFAPDEDRQEKGNVVVISNKAWRERFGQDPKIIGRQLTLNAKAYTVIGVLPADSSYDRGRTEIWRPLVFEPKDMTRNFHWFRSFARLKPGVTLEQARAEMTVIGARIEKQYPDSNKGWGVTVDRFVDRVVGDQLKSSIYMMMATVAAVLLIGCTNLANLTLARGTSREKEVAIRASLGAGKFRLIRQFLTENLLLAMLGGTLGLAVGYGLLAGLKALVPPFMLPSEANVAIDTRVLLFTLAIAGTTGVLFGMAPALQAAGLNLASSMKDGGRGSTASRGRRHLRSGLVVLEIALAFLLVTGAGLLIRSFHQLQNVNAGFDSTNVVTMGLPFPPDKFKDGAQAAAHVRLILDSVGSIAGVRDVAVTSALPLQGWSYGMPFQIEGKPFKDRANRDAGFFKMVSDGYFRSFGIQIKRGRGLSAQDVKGAPPVVVINETMVKRFFGDDDPIGRRILVQEIVYAKPQLGPEIPWEVVGVIADEKVNGLDDTKSGGMYVSYNQSPGGFVNLVVKGIVNPETLQQAIRHEVQRIDSDQPLTDVRTMDQIKTESTANARLRTMLLGIFAGLALLLSAIGIYGVISYSVAQRTHEMGVRLALGASRGAILRLIVGNGILLTGIGLALGLAGALGLAKLIKTLLFGISETDPATMAGTGAILLLVALLACYIPARRATVVDPLTALRQD